MQIFFLLLLTRAFIPEAIQIVIKGLEFASNIYEYMQIRKIKIYPSILREFEFELTNTILDPVGISSDSTIANIYSIFLSLILMLVLYICICFLKLIFSKYKESQKCCLKFCIWVIQKAYIFFTFDYFIRNTLEIAQFIMISSFNEIYEHNTTSNYRIVSLVVAFVMIFYFALVLCLIIYLTFSSHRLKEDEHNKLGEFFKGLKQNKKSKFYVAIQFMRRFIFIILLITLASINSRTLIGIMTFIQIFYAIYIL